MLTPPVKGRRSVLNGVEMLVGRCGTWALLRCLRKRKSSRGASLTSDRKEYSA